MYRIVMAVARRRARGAARRAHTLCLRGACARRSGAPPAGRPRGRGRDARRLRPGRELRRGDAGCAARLRDIGARGAWREHYQGGPIGYRQREFELVAHAERSSRWFDTPLADGHALAWNPSVAGGGKCEDTYLARDGGLRRLTDSGRWPLEGGRCPRSSTSRRGRRVKARRGPRTARPAAARRAAGGKRGASPTAPRSESRSRASKARACSRR